MIRRVPMAYKPKRRGQPIQSMKAREYSEKAGFKDINVTKLEEIRTIHRREAPAWTRIASNWPYYMISGNKSYCRRLLIL
ncbi:MAG: hypothetical protein WAX02_04820 [Methanothrix sp.]|jgi:hypothetical protein